MPICAQISEAYITARLNYVTKMAEVEMDEGEYCSCREFAQFTAFSCVVLT